MSCRDSDVDEDTTLQMMMEKSGMLIPQNVVSVLEQEQPDLDHSAAIHVILMAVPWAIKAITKASNAQISPVRIKQHLPWLAALHAACVS